MPNWNIQNTGSSLMLRANGWGGSSATVLAAHFAKRNTKFGGGGKARAGKSARIFHDFLGSKQIACERKKKRALLRRVGLENRDGTC